VENIAGVIWRRRAPGCQQLVRMNRAGSNVPS
jgi:hypothetical protein